MTSRPPLLSLAAVVLLAAACEANNSASGEHAADSSVMISQQAAAPAMSRTPGRSGIIGEASKAMRSSPMAAAAPTGSPAPFASGSVNEAEVPDVSAATSASAASSASAMIIRTGAASVEVASIDTAVTLVRQLAARMGGYVANTSLQSGRDQQRTATLELKIPADRYPTAVAGLSPLGRVETVTESAEDVGEEFVDVEARVTNARRLEARIVDLLAHRTGKLADVLEAEHELARVREEIERYEGRMRFLRTRAAVSTLTITVHERLQVVAREEGRSPISNAVRSAWRNFVGFVAGLISMLGVLVPVALLLWLLWWLVVRLVPRNRPGSGPLAE